MTDDFTHTILGRTGLRVHRLGLSASYWPGRRAIYQGIDAGINFFFAFGIDLQMIAVMRDVLKSNRQQYVLATGAYNLIVGYPNLRRTLEKRLRQFRTDYIDVFLLLGVRKEGEFPPRAREELSRLREEGKVRAVGISSHDRRLIGQLASQAALDVYMVRYNAAHRGAELDIFPYLQHDNPGIVSYTATRWTYLLRRPKTWPKDGPVPTAGQVYRFVLSNPHVHVCLTAPRNRRQLTENLAALRQGPLSEDEMRFVKSFGDAVHRQSKWFM
jgi:aryl-alcohol dehydrogenase-like predicted oxidoreductase